MKNAIFLIMLYFGSTAEASVQFSREAYVDQQSDTISFVEQSLTQCQRDTLLGTRSERPTRAQAFIRARAEKAYTGFLTDADIDFIAKNPRLVIGLRQLPKLSANFVEMVCENFVHNDTQTDIFQHVAINLITSSFWGVEKGCEMSTAHEMKSEQDYLNESDREAGILELENRQYGKVLLGASDRMDLINNRAALDFYNDHPDLSKKCVQEMRLRSRVRSNAFLGLNYEGWISESDNERFTKIAKKRNIFGSCKEVARILITDKKYRLTYIKHGQSNQCSAFKPEIEASIRNMEQPSQSFYNSNASRQVK